MKTLIIDEEGKPPVVIRYHINLLGEIEPRFPDCRWLPEQLKYYNRVLLQHVRAMELERKLKENK
tara:strand:+ start:282 stop:476 length:195 start_codon:yes stop_codon:yes gene_type:complete